MVTRISRDFTLEELCKTSAPFPNKPSLQEIRQLVCLATYILQPIRDRVGKYRINSGFRSKEVNHYVGGVDTSDHIFGSACDGHPVEYSIDDTFRWLVLESGIKFGQAILELRDGHRWIHVSLPRYLKPNQEALVYNNGVYAPYEP